MSTTSAVKIVILGGSSVGTPELIESLRRQPVNKTLHITLHGRTSDKLNPVARVATQMAQGCDWLRVSSTTDLAEALDGADYIVNQVRVGGLAARAFDETFPISLGIPGEETVGPGGFANALRTVPEVIKLAKSIEQYAPDALLLSFTNPASVIQYALMKTTHLRIIGLCDGSVTMTNQAAAALGGESSELIVDYVGMHHFGFITRLIQDGRDETAAMLDGLNRVTGLDMDIDLVRSLGALPTPYFRYFIHADRMLERQRAQQHSRAQQLMAVEVELLAEFAQSEGRPAGLAKRSAKWYDAIIAPVILALVEQQSKRFILNVRNDDCVNWLPHDAIIETPCLLEGDYARPLTMPTPNNEIKARVQLNCAYEQLMVEAILEQSEIKALRALTMNPMVPSVNHARNILKLIWPDASPTPKGH
jgi:6-phospho-beta-glucosidase